MEETFNNLEELSKLLTKFDKTKHFENGYIERLPSGEIKIGAYFSDDDTERIGKETTYKANTRFYISYGIFVLILTSIFEIPLAMASKNLLCIIIGISLWFISLLSVIVGIYRKIIKRRV